MPDPILQSILTTVLVNSGKIDEIREKVILIQETLDSSGGSLTSQQNLLLEQNNDMISQVLAWFVPQENSIEG